MLPAANHAEGEVSLSHGRHWDWLRMRRWQGVALSSAAAGIGGRPLGTSTLHKQLSTMNDARLG